VRSKLEKGEDKQ